jgi:hypothetical protein
MYNGANQRYENGNNMKNGGINGVSSKWHVA